MAEYIEREALVEGIKKLCCADCDNYRGVMCRACKVDDVLMHIDDAPAADVAPVVHSRWIETKDQNKKRCGRCDVIHLIAQYPNGNANFCPNCGAKMDGGGHGN